MNFSPQQIKLAGGLGEEETQRDFEVGLDLQGSGIRSLRQAASVTGEVSDCEEDLSVCESERAALEAENKDLTTENEDLQEEVEDAAQVGGGGGSVSAAVLPYGTNPMPLSVNLSCYRIEENSTQAGKFTRYHWACTWTAGVFDPYASGTPTPLSGGSEFGVVWVNNLGEEKFNRSVISQDFPGFTGLDPWDSELSSSCTFYTDLSPFTSNLTATIFNTVRFELRANATYAPRSARTPVLYRELGNGSQTNGTTIDPNA